MAFFASARVSGSSTRLFEHKASEVRSVRQAIAHCHRSSACVAIHTSLDLSHGGCAGYHYCPKRLKRTEAAGWRAGWGVGRAIRVELEVPTTNTRGLPAHAKSMQHFQSDFAIHSANYF